MIKQTPVYTNDTNIPTLALMRILLVVCGITRNLTVEGSVTVNYIIRSLSNIYSGVFNVCCSNQRVVIQL